MAQEVSLCSLVCFMIFCSVPWACFSLHILGVTLMTEPLGVHESVSREVYLRRKTHPQWAQCRPMSWRCRLRQRGGKGERAKRQHSSCFLTLQDLGVPGSGVCCGGLCHAFPAIMAHALLISEHRQILQPLSCFSQVPVTVTRSD